MKIAFDITRGNVHILLVAMSEAGRKCGNYFRAHYGKEISEIAREYPRDALKYGYELLSNEDFNFCARKEPDIGLRYVPHGVLNEETLEYWRDESPDTYGNWLEEELRERGSACSNCKTEFLYDSCDGHLICEEGCRVLTVADAELILDIYIKRRK